MASKPRFNLIGLIVLIIGLISMACGAAIWASSEHADIRDFAATKDSAVKTELKQDVKDNFVHKQNHSELKAYVEGQREDIKEIKTQVNAIHNIMIKQEPRVIRFRKRRDERP